MPSHVGGVISDILWSAGVNANDAKVLLLGWSYKAEVGDPRETPAEPLSHALNSKGIKVGVWDPHLSNDMYPEFISPISSIDDAERL